MTALLRKVGASFIIVCLIGLAAVELSGVSVVNPAKVPAVNPHPVMPYVGIMAVLMISVPVFYRMAAGMYDNTGGR